MKILRKLDTGEDLIGAELEIEIKTVEDSEGKALGDNQIEIIGTTGAKDRDGESIDPKGIDLKAFKKNPVILPQHDYKKPAIGKATNIKKTDNGLVFKIEFPEDGINPEADVYRKLYKSGFMNASSIGFIPKEWTDGDGKKTPWRTYDKSELLELSLVSVPANSEAVVVARDFVSKGVISEKEANVIGLDISEAVETKEGDAGYMYGEYIEEHTTLHGDLERRLTFIEGMLAGLTKKSEVEETKSYIGKLLGVAGAEKTEQQTDEQEDVKAFVKNILKGE